MRLALLLLPFVLCAQPRVDNVLVRMVPPGTTSLVGVRMDEARTTAFYRQLVEARKMPQIDEFARETGFDPRRDVREVLYANLSAGSVVIARGSFRLNRPRTPEMKLTRHGVYNIWSREGSGYCILDSTLAAAGDVKAIQAVLDEWKSGMHTGAQPLLNRLRTATPATQFWGVSTGFAGFVAEHMPKAGEGLDFSRIFNGLENTWFQVSLATGFNGEVHGMAANDADATRLRDAVKGLIGYGRLSVPQNQPEMLKFWDAITAETQGRNIIVRADLPVNMVDRLVGMLSAR